MGKIFWATLAVSLLLAIPLNRVDATASALLSTAESGVSLMLTLLGTMTLWGGVMEILLQTGDVGKLGETVRKRFGKHSKMVPDAQCWTEIGMNLAANVLGLGNAATPPGVSAAKRLAAHGEGGLRLLALLLVVNNAGFQLLPTTVLSIRQASGAAHPADVWGAMLLSSAVSMVSGVLLLMGYWKIRERGKKGDGHGCVGCADRRGAADSPAREKRGR